jgi:hypothetical protein
MAAMNGEVVPVSSRPAWHDKVLMISDALSGRAHGLHEATLATFYRIFGDVRPSEDVIRLLR